MRRARITQRSLDWIENGIEGGHEHLVRGLYQESSIDFVQQSGRARVAVSLRTNQAAGHRHIQGGGRALPGNVGKDDSPTAIRQRKKVKEVTRYLAGWTPICLNGETVDPWGLGWQEALLHGASHFKFLFQSNPLLLGQVV